MIKLFITYPDAAPGIGLLWLRLAVCVGLASIVADSRWSALPPWAACIGAGILVVILLVGFRTRLGAVVAASVHLLVMFSSGLLIGIAELAFIAQAFALVLLGPGAYSLDSRMFGRRLIFESRGRSNGE